MLVPTSHQMRELDHMAIEDLGIPGAVLMENAGRGTVAFMEQHFGPFTDQHVLIFIGPGNNGGDGSVIARTLVNKQATPHVFLLAAPSSLTGDALLNYQVVEKMAIDCSVLLNEKDIIEAEQYILSQPWQDKIHSIVDALFGIGLDREVEGRFQQAIQLINNLKSRLNLQVAAVDIPSGLNSDSGRVMGCAVHADLTVTYGHPKPGHFHHGGQGVGTVETVDIGIPQFLHQKISLDGYALTPASIPPLMHKPIAAHKGTNGHLLILAGSTGKTGAAILSAKAALHSGTGLVTLGVPADLNPVFEISLAEAMTVPLKHSQGMLDAGDYDEILTLAKGKKCIVMGPGIGTDPTTAQLVLDLYRKIDLPMVLDADALNILAAAPDTLASPGGPRIFTPHPGEMAKLLDVPVQEVQSDRLAAAKKLATAVSATDQTMVIILKGAGTVIAVPDGKWCVNTSGNPGMGAGGMGDILTGVIGSLVCQGYDVWDASCLGVFLHGFSADILAQTTPVGYTASDVASNLPLAMSTLSGKTHSTTQE